MVRQRDNKKTILSLVIIVGLVVAMIAAVFFMIKFDQANNQEETMYSEEPKQDNGNGLALPGEQAKSEAKLPLPPGQKPGIGEEVAKPVRSQTTDNGLKIEEYISGTGDQNTKVGDTVVVQYIGYFEDGRVFDTSLKGEKKPFAFKLGAGQVISGWDIGLQDMKQGAMRRLYIPAALAYGARGAGSSIPPNTNLIFDVQLVAIQ